VLQPTIKNPATQRVMRVISSVVKRKMFVLVELRERSGNLEDSDGTYGLSRRFILDDPPIDAQYPSKVCDVGARWEYGGDINFLQLQSKRVPTVKGA